MRPLIGLPRLAHIVCSRTIDLRIKNYQVVNPHGLVDWAIRVIRLDAWDEAVPQMISQGFQYKSFQKQCINDLGDSMKFAEVLYWFVQINDTGNKRIKLASDPTGKKTAMMIINKICVCHDWAEFHTAMKPGGEFQKNIINSVQKEIQTQCDL